MILDLDAPRVTGSPKAGQPERRSEALVHATRFPTAEQPLPATKGLQSVEMRRTIALVACTALLGGSCTSDSGSPRKAQPSRLSPIGETPTPGASAEALIMSLPDDCSGIGRTRPEGQISFLARKRLYLATGDGEVRCAGDLSGADSIEWNGTGGRALLSGPDGSVLADRGIRTHVAEPAARVAFSRPTGSAILRLTEDHRRLEKTSLDRLTDVTDISFLRYTDAAVYHPAGTHIAVAGAADDGTYGIWLSDNLGREPKPIARGESFRGAYDPDSPRIVEMAWSHSGDALYFVADHGDEHHVHALTFIEGDDALLEGLLETLATGPEPMTRLEVSEFTGRRRVAFARGSCEQGFTTTVVERRRDPGPLHEGPNSTVPVGWLPDGRLVLQSSLEPCSESSDLHLWSGGSMKLLVTDVSVAAIRARSPEPPDPPAPVGEQVVA